MQPMFILTRFGKYGVLGLCLKLLLVIRFSPWDDLGGRRGRCCEGSSHRQSHTTGSSAQVPIATVAQTELVLSLPLDTPPLRQTHKEVGSGSTGQHRVGRS